MILYECFEIFDNDESNPGVINSMELLSGIKNLGFHKSNPTIFKIIESISNKYSELTFPHFVENLDFFAGKTD